MRIDRGSVTAEAAVITPVLVFVAVAGMAAVAVVGAQLRCIDAAREGARAAARGEPAAVVQRAAAQAAPGGARVELSYQGERVLVVVSAEVRVPAGLVPAISVVARAVARQEPDAVGCCLEGVSADGRPG